MRTRCSIYASVQDFGDHYSPLYAQFLQTEEVASPNPASVSLSAVVAANDAAAFFRPILNRKGFSAVPSQSEENP